MYDLIIFDMDGTLLNTLTDLHISTNFALDALGFTNRTFNEVRNFVGNGVEMLIKRALPENSDDETVSKCITIFKKHYAENMYKHTAPYEGIVEVLRILKDSGEITNQKGIYPSPTRFSVGEELLLTNESEFYNSGEVIKTAVVSNKFDLAVQELTKKYFDGLFDLAVGQSDVIPPKPNPSGVLKCIKELNSKNPIYVGDSDVDIQTAKNANIPVIGVSWGFRDKSYLKGADYIIDKPQELIEIIN